MLLGLLGSFSQFARLPLVLLFFAEFTQEHIQPHPMPAPGIGSFGWLFELQVSP